MVVLVVLFVVAVDVIIVTAIRFCRAPVKLFSPDYPQINLTAALLVDINSKEMLR